MRRKQLKDPAELDEQELVDYAKEFVSPPSHDHKRELVDAANSSSYPVYEEVHRTLLNLQHWGRYPGPPKVTPGTNNPGVDNLIKTLENS